MTGESINPAADPDNNEERGRLHRELLERHDIPEASKSGMALEALARGDVELFMPLAQELQQSADPQIVGRANSMLQVYADFATGQDPSENPALQSLFEQ